MTLAVVFSLLSFGSAFAQVETAKIKDGTISNGATKAKDGAIFELESNNKGMLISRMSTAQRNAITPANLSNGLLVFNTNTNCFDYWDALRVQWLSMCGTPPPAVFDVSAAQCSAVIANGTYKQGVSLSGENTLTVPVTVTQAGTYTMTATTANGYYFEASGSFPNAGVYDITLKGTGRPSTGYDKDAAGDTISLILNGVVCDCQPHIYVEKANVDFAISCGSIVSVGTYNIGIPLTSANKLMVTLDVTNTGFWSIKTPTTINGYSFSGQGTFTTTGSQTVELLGTGTPIASGTDLFGISSNATTVAGGSCTGISVTVAPVAYTMDCTKATQSGAYMQNVALNSTTNTITLPVNVTATGATTITTNTVNGVSFSSGPIVLTKLGADTVVLKGSGTPLTGDATNLTITGTPGAAGNCSFNLAISKQPIAFTMTCGGITTSGSYVPNVAMTAENTMAVPVNVTYAGDYNISTDTVNGISFSATGTFNGTGNQTVTLKASGTPTGGGTYNYSVTTNSTSSSVTCTKSILFTYRTMNVIGIGDGLYNPASANSGQASSAVIASLANFGPTGTVKMMGGFKFFNLGAPSATTLKNSINTNNVDIIHIAYNFQPNTDVITVLADFVKNKKGVVIFASERDANIPNVISGITGSSVTTQGANNGVGRNIANLSTSTDPILNGPFGNISGLNMGGDVDNSIFLTSAPANSTVLALEKGSTTKVFSFKDNTLGFVFIGDAGYNAGVINNNQNGNYPAKMGTGGVPLAKPNYGYDSNVTVYNTIFYANLFAWAIEYAQTNTVKTYILP